jgi:hypothetical protein
MNDKNPTPENPSATPTPPAPPAPDAAMTVPVEPVAAQGSTPAEPAASAAKPGRKRALLIGGGIAAALLLAGGGVAVGAAIGDDFGDDDDRPSASDGQRPDDGQRDEDGQRDDDRDDRQDDATTGQGQNGSVTGIGTSSADDLIAIADAARGAAEGDVTSIDAKRDGTWEVQLTDTTGRETEVRVDADLAATVVSTDDDDDDDAGPAFTLDEATIRALVDAALAEADGLITDLDVDDDGSSPYDVSVLMSDRRSIDIDLSADFAVVGTDTDD